MSAALRGLVEELLAARAIARTKHGHEFVSTALLDRIAAWQGQAVSPRGCDECGSVACICDDQAQWTRAVERERATLGHSNCSAAIAAEPGLERERVARALEAIDALPAGFSEEGSYWLEEANRFIAAYEAPPAREVAHDCDHRCREGHHDWPGPAESAPPAREVDCPHGKEREACVTCCGGNPDVDCMNDDLEDGSSPRAGELPQGNAVAMPAVNAAPSTFTRDEIRSAMKHAGVGGIMRLRVISALDGKRRRTP